MYFCTYVCTNIVHGKSHIFQKHPHKWHIRTYIHTHSIYICIYICLYINLVSDHALTARLVPYLFIYNRSDQYKKKKNNINEFILVICALEPYDKFLKVLPMYIWVYLLACWLWYFPVRFCPPSLLNFLVIIALFTACSFIWVLSTSSAWEVPDLTKLPRG